MKKISLLFALLTNLYTFSQSKVQFELNIGTAFQKEIIINNESLEKTNAFGIRFGVNYLKSIYKKIYIETGIYSKYNYSSNEIETTKFTSNSLKIQLPLYLGYKLNEVWKINIGASVENNRNSDNIDFKLEHNLRFDFLTKIIYIFNENIHFSLYSNWMLHNVSDAFTISNPRNGLYLGVIYQLGKNKSKEI